MERHDPDTWNSTYLPDRANLQRGGLMPGQSFIATYLDRELDRARARVKLAREQDRVAGLSSTSRSSIEVARVVLHMVYTEIVSSVRSVVIGLVIAAIPLLVIGAQRLFSQWAAILPSIVLAGSTVLLLLLLVQWRIAAGVSRRGAPRSSFGITLNVTGLAAGVPALIALSASSRGVHVAESVQVALAVAPLAAVLALTCWKTLMRLAAGERVAGPGDQFDETTLLDQRIARLTTIRTWMQDATLRTLVDEAIGKQVQQSARRQAIYSAAIALGSLVAGWLLSAISPVSLLHR